MKDVVLTASLMSLCNIAFDWLHVVLRPHEANEKQCYIMHQVSNSMWQDILLQMFDIIQSYFALHPQVHYIKAWWCVIAVFLAIVGILIFISRINTTSESFQARNVFIFKPFSFF